MPLRAGVANPPAELPAGLKSTLRCRLSDRGIIAYKFVDRDDDETIQQLRADVGKSQQASNELLFYFGAAAAATIAILYLTKGRAPEVLREIETAAEVGERKSRYRWPPKLRRSLNCSHKWCVPRVLRRVPSAGGSSMQAAAAHHRPTDVYGSAGANASTAIPRALDRSCSPRAPTHHVIYRFPG